MRRAAFQPFRSEGPSSFVRRQNARARVLMESQRTAHPVLAHAPAVASWPEPVMVNDAAQSVRYLCSESVMLLVRLVFAARKQTVLASEFGALTVCRS